MLHFKRKSCSKILIFSTFSCTVIVVLIIHIDTFISNLSPNLVVLENHQKLNPSPIEEIEEINYNYNTNLKPPIDVTISERIAWFNTISPNFEFIKSTDLSRKFNTRVGEFLGNNTCENQFFMTWIAPAGSFGEREFFTLVTLFKSHPKGCLVILSRSLDSAYGKRILKPLLDSGNQILAVTPDLSTLLENTPVESWFSQLKKGEIDPGEIPLAQNLSNLIRFAVLYKYGGVYLDTDFIILKGFSQLRNSIGAQSVDLSGNWTRLNNAVLIFDKSHQLLYNFLEEFASNFDGNRWGHNGPYLVSRVVAKLPNNEPRDFTILPPIAFYPVDWTKVKGLFEKPVTRSHSKWVEAKVKQLRGSTYGVHLWNRKSFGMKIEEGSVISRLISDNCVFCKNFSRS